MTYVFPAILQQSSKPDIDQWTLEIAILRVETTQKSPETKFRLAFRHSLDFTGGLLIMAPAFTAAVVR